MQEKLKPILENKGSNFKDWEIFNELYKNYSAPDGDSNEDLIHRASLHALLTSLRAMGEVKCTACSGRGHHSDMCQTGARLNMIGNSGSVEERICMYGRD